jgi:hypothetical protein
MKCPHGIETLEAPAAEQGAKYRNSTWREKSKSLRYVEHTGPYENDRDDADQTVTIKNDRHLDEASEKGKAVMKKGGTRGGTKKKADNVSTCIIFFGDQIL